MWELRSDSRKLLSPGEGEDGHERKSLSSCNKACALPCLFGDGFSHLQTPDLGMYLTGDQRHSHYMELGAY